MDLTIHGTERIQGRTRMRVQDVRSLITQQKFVSLGKDDEREYLLFYSPPDNDAKIAVVSLDRKILVSIWEKYFRLPRGLKKVTPKRIRAARMVQIFKSRTENDRGKTWRFSVALDVIVGKKTVYTHECGFMPVHPVHALETTLPFIRPFLESVVPIIESRTDIDKTRVRYDFWYTHELSLKKHRLKLSHDAAKEHVDLM